jgi:histone H3/H4
MTRDEALEQAIEACTQLMQTAAEYFDMETAEIAAEGRRKLIAMRDFVNAARKGDEKP